MIGSSIEQAIKSLYSNGNPVRRLAWPEGKSVCLPDFHYYDPVMQDGSAFQPDSHDLLIEDWVTVNGEEMEVKENHRNGFYAAMKRVYATGDPVTIDIWDKNTWVFMPLDINGVLCMHYLEDGMPFTSKYIPSRDDYLSDKWRPKILE